MHGSYLAFIIHIVILLVHSHSADCAATNKTEVLRDEAETIISVTVKCPENEFWSDCTGCELTCDQPGDTACSSVCKSPSCECRAFLGYRRHSNGSCIHKEDCPLAQAMKQCTVVEEYNECGPGCERTCATLGEEHLLCTKECVAGCFCVEGFVRDHEGGCCVPEDRCSSTNTVVCGPNKEYQECGTSCPETCSGKPELCTLECVAGCFCKEGFVLNGDDCIPREECPAVE